ncbi:MAG: hypothetical protein ACOX8B_03525 [Lachnospiraceae bacterium]
MKRYYDLVMANAVRQLLKKGAPVDLPGTVPEGTAEQERWGTVKKEFSGSELGVITEWGLIDFDPAEKEKLVGGDDLSYDEYLDLQKKSGRSVRQDFEKAYHDASWVSFKGCIQRINSKKGKICFEKIFVEGEYPDGDGFYGKEDHVWMDLKEFEPYGIGTCLAFQAEIYRYVKTGNGKMIDFGLRNPSDIKKIESYELPSDDDLRRQEADEIICSTLCMFRDQCNGQVCLANENWRESMRKLLLGNGKPAK